MPHTFTQLSFHAVFATKGRTETLTPAERPRVHAYLAALINDELGFAQQVGGTADHVHLLLDLKPTVAVADCMRKVKSISSGWIRQTFPGTRWAGWQEGYGAFSVSASVVPQVKEYIGRQEQRHERRSFQDEFAELLKRHGIPYDPRDMWQEPAWHGDGS